jgi:glutamate-5-semialdehyde dehydrogenase
MAKRNESETTIEDIGMAARAAAQVMTQVSTEQKNKALYAMASQLRQGQNQIIAANKKDIALGNKLNAAKINRLTLDEARIEAMAKGLEDIARLDDPIGVVMDSWSRPNGLEIERRRTPLGVIGMIFESRPNVNADAGGLCLKSGNSVILRPGSESTFSSIEIHACLLRGLDEAALPKAAISLAPLGDRSIVSAMLSGLGGTIDVIVPRGGRSLVERVQNEARVPVFAHLEGICHIYIDRQANPDRALAISLNAKMRHTGICGTAETILIDKAFPEDSSAEIIQALIKEGCEVRGDRAIQKLNDKVVPATTMDWSTEYLDAIISIKQVEGLDQAMDHIKNYGSSHTESIITENKTTAETFLNKVDSAIVMHNASTQFADGGEFGMGAEIGIATGRFHARGPVGLEQLTSFKYIVRGQGHCRT